MALKNELYFAYDFCQYHNVQITVDFQFFEMEIHLVPCVHKHQFMVTQRAFNGLNSSGP